MRSGPVTGVGYGEARKERLAALEQLLDRVDQQGLAGPPRAGEKIVLALIDHPGDEGRLVDVVTAPRADLDQLRGSRRRVLAAAAAGWSAPLSVGTAAGPGGATMLPAARAIGRR